MPSRVAITLCVVVLALVVLARPAGAHATLLSTEPVADNRVDTTPTAVELRFSEPVAVTDGGLRVFAPGGGGRADRATQRVENGHVLRAELNDAGIGTYTVAWRVTSDDGHTITGSFVFHVRTVTGEAAITEEATSSGIGVAGFVGRWSAFSGTLLLAGALTIAAVAGDAEVLRRSRGIAAAAAVAAVVGAAVNIGASNAQATGRGLLDGLALLWEFIDGQRTGQLAFARLLALAAATVLILLVARTWAFAGAAAATVAAMALTSAGGHAWTVSPNALAVANDVVHQIAAGIWLGGAAVLFAVLGHASQQGRLAARFSTVALWAALMVGATGALSSWLQVRSVDALTDTVHGRLILAKIVGFVVLIAIGWRNRTHLVAWVEREPRPLVQGLRIESLAALVVLAVTAALVAQQPARLALARPFEATIRQPEVTVQLSVQPARAGVNDIHLYFFDRSGAGLAAVDAVQIDAGVGDIPPRRLKVNPISPNHVSVYGASLSAGLWTLSVTAVRKGAAETFTVEVPIR